MNGFLLLDKPEGLSSQQAISQIKRILKVKKAGHGGTLDPFATGVLPIAIGEATKFIEYIFNDDKEYEFTVKFGAETDTFDKCGQVTETINNIPNLQEIQQIIPEFTGEIEQIPPKYSAIKINGKRAYDLARNNEEFEIKPRNVKIYSLEIIGNNLEMAEMTFKAMVSKGTYIRTLAIDIARKLNSLCFVKELRRTKFGKIDISETITLEKLKEIVYADERIFALKQPEEILDDIPVLQVNQEIYEKIKLGQSVKVNFAVDNGIYLLNFNNLIFSISDYQNLIIKPIKNLNV